MRTIKTDARQDKYRNFPANAAHSFRKLLSLQFGLTDMKKTLLINMLWLSAFPLAAQSYMEKAETFSRDTLNDLVLNDYPSIEWMGEDSRYFSYQVETPENRTFYLVDTKNWKKTQFFDRKEIKPYVDSLRGWGGQKSGKP